MKTQAIDKTDFRFNGQTDFYQGKVRDVYTINNDILVSVATDRISAFDVMLPRSIPHKGQVLNQLAAHFLEFTKDIVPNWLIATPDPNVSIGRKCQPVPIEMVVRGCLVGHAWRLYKEGERQLCGKALPEGMQEYDTFSKPIITPTTKAREGHDQDISPQDIIKRQLATAALYKQMEQISLNLFARGQDMAYKQGLILADTKYEFGLYDDQLVLIDEVHTPDSSRYFYQDSYERYQNQPGSAPPKHLSKEFVRQWLLELGFSGQPGQTMPDMTDTMVLSISRRYIELFERLSGKRFEPATSKDRVKQIETAVNQYLEEV